MIAKIKNIDSNTFSLNGVNYPKIFIAIKSGDGVRISCAYDSSIEILPVTAFSSVSVNNNTYSSVLLLINALKNVVGYFSASGGTPLTQAQLDAIASVANKADKITEQIVNPNPTTGTTPTKHTATFQINQKEAEVFIDLGLISLLEITHPTVNITTYTILKFKITGITGKNLAFTSQDNNVKFINNSSTDAINNITLFGNSEASKSSIYTFKLVHQVIGTEKKVFINYTNSKEF